MTDGSSGTAKPAETLDEDAKARLAQAAERVRLFRSGAFHAIEGSEAFIAALEEYRAAEGAVKALPTEAPSRLAA